MNSQAQEIGDKAFVEMAMMAIAAKRRISAKVVYLQVPENAGDEVVYLVKAIGLVPVRKMVGNDKVIHDVKEIMDPKSTL